MSYGDGGISMAILSRRSGVPMLEDLEMMRRIGIGEGQILRRYGPVFMSLRHHGENPFHTMLQERRIPSTPGFREQNTMSVPDLHVINLPNISGNPAGSYGEESIP